jgi:hypothetical protein
MHHRFSVAEAASLAQKLPPGTGLAVGRRVI